MLIASSNSDGSINPGADPRSWAHTVEAGKRLGRLTLWTAAGLAAATGLVALWGRNMVFQRIEDTYTKVQLKTTTDQAHRIARLLEQELAAGVPPTTVRRHLQESLARSPYDEAGFLCLLDDKASVLCHPNETMIGTQVPFSAGTEAGGGGQGVWLTGQTYAGDTHLVVRHPVAGVPWQVSVHSNLDVMRDRVTTLRRQVTLAAVPLLAGFVVLGTLAARLAGRAYERKIEDTNRNLEAKVAARTSDLVAAVRHHQEIIDAAPSAIFLCDATGAIRRANTQASHLVGRPVRSLLGLLANSLWSWQDRPVSLPDTTPQAARAAHLTGPDGSERHLHVFTRALNKEKGGGTMFVVQDVTALKTLEREFQQAQKMEAVGQLAAGVAHDFNNLLGATLGFTELARMQSSEPVVRERLQQAVAAIQRAGRISQQLLAFSRKQVLEPQVAELPALVEETGKVLERVLGEGIELEICHDRPAWRFKVDPTQFEQVLLNLAINARDAMEGRGRLFLRTHNVPAGTDNASRDRCLLADCVCLEVEDTGPGVPPAIQARIFEPFFTTKEAGRGTGLGLASVQGIVRQHGGYIELRSEAGRGARFAVFFPRHEDLANPGGGSLPPVAVMGRGQRLLLVEDEPALRESLCALLESRGHACVSCGTRTEALARLADGSHYHAVVCDVVMPGASLTQFLAEARRHAPAIRVVLMSGYATGAALEEAKAANAPILRKPFTIEQLTTVLAVPFP